MGDAEGDVGKVEQTRGRSCRSCLEERGQCASLRLRLCLHTGIKLTSALLVISSRPTFSKGNSAVVSYSDGLHKA